MRQGGEDERQIGREREREREREIGKERRSQRGSGRGEKGEGKRVHARAYGWRGRHEEQKGRWEQDDECEQEDARKGWARRMTWG